MAENIPYPTFFIDDHQLSDFFLIIVRQISRGIKHVLVITLAEVSVIEIWLLISDRKISSEGHDSCYLSYPNNTLSDTLPYALHCCDTLPYDTLPYLHHWYDTLPYDILPYVFVSCQPTFRFFPDNWITYITWYEVCFGDNFGWSTCHKNLLTQIRREYIFLWSWKVLPFAYNKYIEWYLTLPSPLIWYLTLRYLTLRFCFMPTNFPIFSW